MTKKTKSFKDIHKVVKAGLCLSIGLMLSAPAMAEYPKRPISLVIPYGPGGATDISARALARSLSGEVSKPLVIVNRTGAGGVTGSASVAHAKGDGYTVLAARVGSHTVNPAMKSNLPYALSDFKFVGVYEINPIVCATNSDSGIDSMEQLVSKVQSNPGTVSYSSSGVGSFLQLSAVMILDAFGVKKPLEMAIHLPMRGGGEAVTAVLNGTATFICDNSSTLAGFINNGLMTPLIVTTKERINGIDAPTASELNHPELETLLGWTGIAGPKDMDMEAVKSWEKWLAAATRDPEFVGSMEKLGSVIVNMGAKESEEFINKQYIIFKSLVDKLGMEAS
ncbi:tripartite tricarboxylate transporter substrate binding protein [Pseudomonas sp. MPC6]|uniref:Bug family tripartite tricarboxylate transporter substrate binding protein n=1 Tax=unclassified Pseudomonas TaxID=196821 RepID=UPI001110B5FC|nr:tripartite tricarboxylate transporter substrate binding protein [Pseudomonas sp. MPC6]QCY09563.1 tripartite tricarboxylate transporter substrate binding protein [Pseudomonas sp. MPC6]